MDLPLNQTSFFSSRAVPNIYLITENMKVWNIIHTSKPLLTANRFDRNIQIHPFHRKVGKCTKLLATPAVKYKVLQSYNKNRLKFGIYTITSHKEVMQGKIGCRLIIDEEIYGAWNEGVRTEPAQHVDYPFPFTHAAWPTVFFQYFVYCTVSLCQQSP